MIKVYVAGPYTIGDNTLNLRKMILVADELFNKDYAPYVPLLNHFWHLVSPKSEAEWLRLDFEFITVCDVLLRLPGKSAGADAEVRYAMKHCIYVVFSVQELDSWRLNKNLDALGYKN